MALKRIAMFTIVACMTIPSAKACLWDTDTLQMERSRFPEVLELITGKFLRHSPAFYQWRINDRHKRLQNDESSKAIYNDLAVAFDKTGQHDKAIATIDSKDKLWPGEYETLANKGTFLIHSGKFEEGLTFIRKAIEINPDAHFGREVYQQLLVEYVLARQVDGETKLPLGKSRDLADGVFRTSSNFADFVFKKQKVEYAARNHEREKALKGVLGMMRFGNYDSPILLEALGDLLIDQTDPGNDGKWLACRAYLQASYRVQDNNEASETYRKKAKSALKLHEGAKLETVERQFRKEIREAKQWWHDVEKNEAAWIKAGVDVDAEFSKKYFK